MAFNELASIHIGEGKQDTLTLKKTFEYGLTKRPDDPNFYYNLACAYAEAGDLDQALVNLRKAFQNKENRIKGESIPDPAKDSSFAKYLNDKRFKEFLQSIQN